ncbi:MAG: TraB/GumN family protein [Vicinamibacterales bacterium]
MRRAAVLAVLVLGLSVALPAAPAADRHFLWRVDNGAGPPTFLLGSLHVLTSAHYPLAEPIEAAFAASTVLIEEVDLEELSDPAGAMALVSRAMLPGAQTLDQVVSPSTYAEVTRRAEAAGLPLVAIRRMKPWMAAVTLTAPALARAGYDPEHGVDRYFFDKAKAAGRERRALETVAYQLERFDALPPAEQEAMLTATLEDLDAEMANVDRMAAAWAAGDTAAIEDLLLGSFRDSPALYRRLVVERNQNWVAPVERCLREKTACFVVVGAAHLVGPDSLPALLAARGHVVTQQ